MEVNYVIIFSFFIILYSLSSKNNKAESDETSEEAKTSEVSSCKCAYLFNVLADSNSRIFFPEQFV